MNRNYGRSSRGTANARRTVGAGRKVTKANSQQSSGHGTRGSMRRGPQPKRNNNKNVVIGVIIGCVAIVLVVLVVAMNSDSNGESLEDRYKESEPGKLNKNYESGKLVEGETESKPVEDVVKKDPNKADDDEEDFDDDPSWHEKDPDFKGTKLGDRKLGQ